MARRRPTETVPVVGTLERSGPLGAYNMRRQLGRSARLILNQKQEVTLLQTGAKREEESGPSLGESLARSMILTFTYKLDPTAAQAAASPGNLRTRVLGTLSWGQDGHSEDMDFDWMRGGTIRAPAGFVRLTARVVNGLDDSAPNSNVVVGAFVTYGEPSIRRATLTQRIQTAASPGASITIPARARSVAFWCPSNLIVRQFWGTTNMGAGGTFPTGSSGTFWALPAGITALSLEAAANPTAVFVVWELDT